ncbi:anti-sigma factor domain-containing protein [Paenalcaligenes sp. Me52]|uniref:anti-sigma factor domain-containing protein n=1 Tax=Paenalcaligenes sp. Me52 TaxID=3392038 RepID=UPI003D2B6CA4
MVSRHVDLNTALQLCAKGDQRAFADLYTQEMPRIMAYSLSMLGSPSAAENLACETFVLAWKNSLGFDASLGSAQAWLYSILRYRARAHQQRGASSAGDLPNSTPGHRYSSGLLAYFPRLDQTSKQVVLMAYLQGKNYTDIAQIENTPASQLRRRTRLGIALLRKLLHGQSTSLDEQQLQIAEYTLGLLSDTEQKTIQALLQHDDQVAHDALSWEQDLIALCDLLPQQQPPSETLFVRIQEMLGLNPIALTVDQTSDHQHFQPKLYRADVASTFAIPAKEQETAAVVEPEPEPQPDPETVEDLHHISFSARDDEPSHGNHRYAAAPTAANNTHDDFSPAPTESFTAQRDEPRTETRAKKQKPVKIKKTLTLKLPKPWRIAAIALAVIAVALIVISLLPTKPPITVIEMAPRYGAILMAPGQSSTPGWVMTSDPEGNLLLEPKVHTQLDTNQSAQLWTQRPFDPKPTSLGLIDPNKPVALPVSLIGTVENDQVFEITLENAQGAAAGQPQGPVLFIGRIVRFGEVPSMQAPGAASEAS